ncbi:MAG: hypothetical protein WBG48_13005 [Pricia sp.]
MENWVLRECLQQLLTVYVYAEQQYVHSTIEAVAPMLHVFYRESAFERSDFIMEVQRKMDFLDCKFPVRKTTEEFCSWHDSNYGSPNLKQWPVTDINTLVIDEKALEICGCLLRGPLPSHVNQLIEHQTVRLESSLLSLTYLKALQDKNNLK